MTSPINNINRSASNALSNNASKTQPESTTDKAVQTPADTGDTVSISKETVHIRELQAQLNNISEVDMDKVESIKQEIAKGNYPIDNERIAENLINLEKALID